MLPICCGLCSWCWMMLVSWSECIKVTRRTSDRCSGRVCHGPLNPQEHRSTHVLAVYRKYDEVPKCPQSPWPAPWPPPWLGVLLDASHGRSIYLSLFTYWSTLASLEPAVLQCCSLDGPQPRHRYNQVPALTTIRQSVSTCNETTYTHLNYTLTNYFILF